MMRKVGLDEKTVMQAAADLADTEGLEELTLATRASLLSIRTPTLYHYVNGLQGFSSRPGSQA